MIALQSGHYGKCAGKFGSLKYHVSASVVGIGHSLPTSAPSLRYFKIAKVNLEFSNVVHLRSLLELFEFQVEKKSRVAESNQRQALFSSDSSSAFISSAYMRVKRGTRIISNTTFALHFCLMINLFIWLLLCRKRRLLKLFENPFSECAAVSSILINVECLINNI